MKQAYWDLLHAKWRLGEFSSDVWGVEGIAPERHNNLFVSALYRIESALAHIKWALGKDSSEELEKEFQEWLASGPLVTTLVRDKP